MLRPPEQLLRRPLFDDRAVAHHGDASGDLGHDAEIVGNEQDRHPRPTLDVANEGQYLRLRRHVERGGGLVRDEDARFERQRHGDHGALALPARKLVRIGARGHGRIGQPHLLEEIEHPHADRLPRERFVDAQRLGDLVADAMQRIERRHRVLKDHADLGAANTPQDRKRQAHQILPAEEDASSFDRKRGRQQAEDGRRGHRFARSAFTDKAQDLVVV